MRTEPEIQVEHGRVLQPEIGAEARSRVRSGMLLLARSPDFLLLISSAILFPLLLLIPFPVLRIPLGIILVLFAPGYALITALFPNRVELSGSHVVGLSFGASIAVIPVIALALDLSSAGIRPLPITVSLAIWVGFWTTIAFRRRIYTGAIDPRSLNDFHFPKWSGLRWSRTRSIAAITLLGGIASAAVLGILLVSAIATEKPSTEFYLLGAEWEARDYPRDVEFGELVSVTLGIVNMEEEPRTFHVSIDASDLHLTDPKRRLTSAGPFYVEPGKTYEQTISWRMSAPGRDKAVSFDLYRDGDSEPYRSARLFLDVTAPEQAELN